MNGIENISQKIEEQAAEKVSAILAQAEADAKAIATEAEERIARDVAATLQTAKLRALDFEEKALQASGLERRKLLASQRQALISEVFANALDALVNLPAERYLDLLVLLTEHAVSDGEGGELILNARDREAYGSTVLAEINSRIVGGKLSQVKTVLTTAVEQLLAGERPSVTHIAWDTAEAFSGKQISLSSDIAPILGGVVIRRGLIELNCDLDVIVRMLSEDCAAEISDVLFPKGA